MDGHIRRWPQKAPGARLDYTLDLTSWCALAPSDPLQSVTVVSSSPSGLTVETPNLAGAPLIVVFIDGGTHGTVYEIVFEAETQGERSDFFVTLLPVVDPAIVAASAAGAGQAA